MRCLKCGTVLITNLFNRLKCADALADSAEAARKFLSGRSCTIEELGMVDSLYKATKAHKDAGKSDSSIAGTKGGS